MSSLAPGDFLPDFTANSSINPRFIFNSLGGHRVLLVFLGTVRSELGRGLAEALLAAAEALGRHRILVYAVTVDDRRTGDAMLTRLAQHFTVFWDSDRTIARLYGMDATRPSTATKVSVLRLGAFLIRENLRLHAFVPAAPVAGFPDRLRAAVDTLPMPEPGRVVSQQAPVLIIPDVLDRASCRRFIDHYEQLGGAESGFMRDIDGQTRGVLDPRIKRRKDLHIKDPALLDRLRAALTRRVLPEIRKAFAYEVTRVERYMIGYYDSGDRGFFGAHRDNISKATSHRAFALSLNLNSEDYDGGTLRFPEYGSQSYKPETGSAVVFSCSLLHEALPVTRGRRYVILPFLYDDAAAVRRAENLRFLSDQPPVTV